MFSKMTLLSCLILLVFISGCSDQETELVVSKKNQTAPAERAADKPVPVTSSKPLIVIAATDRVQIVVRQDGAPGMYLGDDGKLHGFYVDLEKMVMEEMGQEYQFIPYSDIGPIIQGIKSGIYHIGLAAPDIPDYRAITHLSIPYETLHSVVFVQKINTDIRGTNTEELLESLHGKKVGVQTQGHIYQFLRDIRKIEVIEYPTTTRALEDLHNGKLDAVPDVKRIGRYYSTLNNWDIMPVGEPILSQRISTAFSKMLDTSLIDRYNIALQSLIDDGRLEVLYESYFSSLEK